MDETEGIVKVLADAKTDRVLGVHIFGPRASDMIAEAVTTMEFAGSAEDIARHLPRPPDAVARPSARRPGRRGPARPYMRRGRSPHSRDATQSSMAEPAWSSRTDGPRRLS